MITYRDLDMLELETDMLWEELMEELEREMMGSRAEVEDGAIRPEQILLQGEEGGQSPIGGEGGLVPGAAPFEFE